MQQRIQRTSLLPSKSEVAVMVFVIVALLWLVLGGGITIASKINQVIRAEPDSQLMGWQREIETHALSVRIREDEIQHIPRSIYPSWTPAEREQYTQLVVAMAAEDRLLERACRLFDVRYFEVDIRNRQEAPRECTGFGFASV